MEMAKEIKIEKLLETGRIGKLELRNRIVMPAMGSSLGGTNGEVTKRLINYYAERAKGGLGLIIVENTLVTPADKYGLQIVNQLRIHDHKYIPGFNELTEAVHEYGAKIAVQINYPGGGIDPALVPGVQAVTPSSLEFIRFRGPIRTRAATLQEIKELVEAYGEGALRAKIAGFDAIELHCVHGYGISGFQSPHTNRRTDMYGGDFDGRMRFGLEIIERIKEKVGDDFPIICRIPADEFVPGGITLEDSKKIARRYEEAGVHAINLSSGTLDTPVSKSGGASLPIYQPRAFLEPYAEEIKKNINIPLILVGGLNYPELAERILRERKADFIAIGRGLIADPDLPNKIKEGRLEDIRKCIRCNEKCISAWLLRYQPIGCAINVEAGREGEYKIRTAEKRKRVLVVGAGPAGMEAARVAALRGHDVILCEKNDKLGGNMIPGSVPEFKEELKYLIEWFSTQLRNLGVKIDLKREVTPQVVLEEAKPDVVIIATGAIPPTPDIPGIEKAVTAVDVLLGKADVGNDIIIAGGGLVGCETALYLAERGKKVTILEMLDDILIDVNPDAKFGLIEKLTEKGVKWSTGLKLEEITDKGVITIDGRWKRKTFIGDYVVLALGLRPVNHGLLKALESKVPELYAIGDCIEPRKIWNAIHEGYRTAYKI